ncbi:hypothetical protein P4C99_21390 [Pontiellaceae bacterium B1224]|nr:hypothetical protein [Pontiellaceae bacterium B1224]
MNEFMIEYLKPLAPVFSLFATALITYLLGRSAYFQQKENEAVRKRFLENTLDLFTSHVEHCLSVHRMNWQTSLSVLKQFRDAGVHIPIEGLNARVCHVDHTNMNIAAAHRMGILLNGNTSFFSMQQLLVAFVAEGAFLLEDDLITSIKLAAKGDIPATEIPSLCEEYFERIKKLDEEARPFYVLLTEASSIAHIFETKRRPTFKNVKSFHKNPGVESSVKKVDDQLCLLMRSEEEEQNTTADNNK